METESPFFVDVEVPDAVLLSENTGVCPSLHPNECDAVWYRGDLGSVTCDKDGAVQEWSPQNGLGMVAVPVKPNQNSLRIASGGGLQFDREVNSGLVIGEALIEAAQFSCAVRFSSQLGDARTLLTINPTDRDNYLFLAEKDGRVNWQDQNETVSLSLPSPKGGGWIIAGFDKGKLSLSVADEGQDCAKAIDTKFYNAELSQDFDGINDVFIGCRSHRKGILKTLGTSCLHDVLLWIDQDFCNTDLVRLQSIFRHCENIGPQDDV